MGLTSDPAIVAPAPKGLVDASGRPLGHDDSYFGAVSDE
ncbi:MAG: NADH-quinone oxidoreductase subunit B, partial [Hyphomicrobiales bacterium]|nr:NADH-quinone oxidoreductase subunit B [Hyphomicrobiales bacterium]